MNVIGVGQTWEYAAGARGGVVRFRIEALGTVFAEVTFAGGRRGTVKLSTLRRGGRSARRVEGS